MRKLLIFISVGLALVIGGSTRASAELIDLTPDSSAGLILAGGGTNGGIAQVYQGEVGSGTGMFPAFVQVHADTGNDTEEDAYNTTAKLSENGSSAEHNHEIRVSDLQTFLVGGVAYYGFLLDINESAGNGDEAISLDQIVLLTSTTPNQNSEPLPTGITRWDMDLGGDDTILLRFDEGSGKADMTLLVPVSAFNGALQTDYVYLYSQFGLLGVADPDPGPAANYGASDGFEEWSIKPGVVTTPDGGVTALMLGLSMLGLGLGARRRNKK